MRVAVIQTPGSNCDQDAIHALRESVGVSAEYLWHADSRLAGYDAVMIPGGFTYGDYLRCGAMAARSDAMESVREFAQSGGPVLGVCNGFQILTEAGILPGAVLRNSGARFVCKTVTICPDADSRWTHDCSPKLRMPVAHSDGRYFADEPTLKELSDSGRIAFRYCGNGDGNPNGSLNDIAGITNEAGNVLGMMPHPERAANNLLGGADGLQILKNLVS